MTKPKEPSAELHKEAVELLRAIKHTMAGLLIEMKGANRRHMSANDFLIDEHRRLSAALERMAAQFEKRSGRTWPGDSR